MQDEHGQLSVVRADSHSLTPLLDPKWLEKNDAAIELLSQFFGFDALDLRLLGIAPGDSERQLLRDGLARLVETAGGNPSTYEFLRQELLAKSRRERNVKRCRDIGLAIQDAIQSALVGSGLFVKVIDHGYDFAVDSDAVELDDLATWLEVGAHLLEIKATRTGNASMTPTQAKTAANNASRYSLCVVDLRDVDEDRLDHEWTASEVVALAKVVDNVGSTIEATYRLVEEACAQPIAIRNDCSLRYSASPSVWETGGSIDEWVRMRFRGKAPAQD